MKRLHTYSQNFLRNPQLVKRLLTYTNISKNDTVFDIGAGSGVITAALARAAKAVVAVEVDPRLAAKLREGQAAQQNVIIQQADILQMRFPRTPYKVFANIPFSLSSEIVQKLTGQANPPTAAYLIVQEQFARKLLPDNKGYTNHIGIALGAEFAVRVRQRLRSEDFYPRPNVPTVFVEIIQRKEPLLPRTQLNAYRTFVAGAFADPRTFWKAPLHQVGLPALASPSRLTLAQWMTLFSFMQSHPNARGLSLLADDDPLLLQKSAPVASNEFTSPSMRFIADRLRAVVGRGTAALAAPRIGVTKRIVGLSDGGQMLVLVNPVVRGRSVTGQDHTGKPVKLQPSGKMLSLLLREIASLDGARR